MKPRLSVIMVTYNSGPLTLLSLWALQEAHRSQTEVLVIDNASTDEIPGAIERHFRFVKLFRNATNLGFGKACNRGMEKAQGDVFLFLNPDTIVPKHFETATLRFFDAHPGAGAMGVKMLSGTGEYLPESKRNLPTPAASFYRFTGLARLFPRSPIFARYYAGELMSDEAGTIEVLSGAFMAVSRTAIDKAGAFDPRFFLYGEDIDLSWRIHQAGFEVWYNPALTILHFKGESTPKTARQARIFYDAMQRFYQKHFTGRYPRLTSVGIRATITVFAHLAALKQVIAPHSAQKPNHTFCLTADSSKQATETLLLNTAETNPTHLISRVQRISASGEQLLIWHPLTRHLFSVAGKKGRSTAIKLDARND